MILDSILGENMIDWEYVCICADTEIPTSAQVFAAVVEVTAYYCAPSKESAFYAPTAANGWWPTQQYISRVLYILNRWAARGLIPSPITGAFRAWEPPRRVFK